jgi:hypothetical protein
MPTVARSDVVKATYDAVSALIRAREIPTDLLFTGRTIFRSFPAHFLPKPAHAGHVSKLQAAKALQPFDGTVERANRFSGPSYNPSIPPAAGLYCVLQQQALVNEVVFYGRRTGVHKSLGAGETLAEAALADRVVVKIVLMGPMLVADLSPHNPGTANFLQKVERTPGYLDILARTQYSSNVTLLSRMVDGDDCSVARGIGLAIANSHLRGLSVQTVRKSGRSPDEQGDNLVLFGNTGDAICGLYVDQAIYFDQRSGTETFPVQFP